MKFNPTFLVIFVFVCLFIFIWTKHGRKIRRCLQAYLRQRRGPRTLKPKSPGDCPLCDRHICFLPHRPKQEVGPWSERILYFKCQACGNCRTSRYRTPLYWLKTPLARISMVLTAMSEGVDISAAGRIFGHHHTSISRWIERCGHHSKRLHERLFQRALMLGLLQLDELVTKVKRDTERLWVWTAVATCRKLILALQIGRRSSADVQQLLHQVWQRLAPDSLPIRGPSKCRYRTPVIAASLVRRRWSV